MQMMNIWKRSILSLGQFIQKRRRNFTVPEWFYTIACNVVLILTNLLLAVIAPNPEIMWSHVTATIAFCLFVFVFIAGKPIRSFIHAYTAFGICYLFINAMYSGGAFSPYMAWFILTPLASLYLIGRLAALSWLGVALSAQIVLLYLTWAERLPPGFSFGADSANWVTTVYFLAAGNLLLLAFIYDLLYEYLCLKLQRYNGELLLAQDALMKEQQRKDEFIATISHELRTPMNAILGFNDLLRMKLIPRPRALDIAEHIHCSADHLLTVINDILDYTQLQAGHLKVLNEPFLLKKTVMNAYRMFEQRIDRCAVDYRCELSDDLPDWVVGDRHRLMQILVNLIGNAVKFTKEGHITLRASLSQGALQFEVDDSGIGIPQEQRKSIFGRFEQVSAETHHQYGGYGLGLSISERLVTIQNGQIGVDSVVGQGSRFWFRLPYEACPPIRELNPVESTLQLTYLPVRMLIVDDNPVNRLVARHSLQSYWPNARFTEAADGVDALQRLREAAFDIVLMDIVMPTMDGIAATHVLRHDLPEPTRSIPVLGLTANVNPADRERCMIAGMNDIVFKPFDRTQLAARVHDLLLESTETLLAPLVREADARGRIAVEPLQANAPKPA